MRTKRNQDLKERFYESVSPCPITGCYWWTSSNDNRRGYGLFYIKRKAFKSHRISYELEYGSIEDGMYVCHKCDNPTCVNPRHLFLGTHEDNMRDMVLKGRSIHRFGKDNPMFGVSRAKFRRGKRSGRRYKRKAKATVSEAPSSKE